ncbi:hypothetical protein HDU90_003730 [Geranomyces variabilis]|nr:hypothetical protein HDU90_003730 [Geranomyces variabilis]
MKALTAIFSSQKPPCHAANHDMMDVDDPEIPHRVIDMGISANERASSQVRIPIPDMHVPKTLEELVSDTALFAQVQETYPEYSVILGFLQLYMPVRHHMRAAQQQFVPGWRDVSASPFAVVAYNIRSLVDRPRSVPAAHRDTAIAADIATFYDRYVLNIGAPWATWIGTLSALRSHYETCVERVEPHVMNSLLGSMRTDCLQEFVTSVSSNWRDNDYGVMTRDGNRASIIVRSRRLGRGPYQGGRGRGHESANANANANATRQLESEVQNMKHELELLQKQFDDLAAQAEQKKQELTSQTREFSICEARYERQIVELTHHLHKLESRASADMATMEKMYGDSIQVQEKQNQTIAFLSEQTQTNAAIAAKFQLETHRFSQALASAEAQLAKTRGRAGMFDSESAFNPREVTQEFSTLANSVRAFVTKIVPNPAAEGNSSAVSKIITLFMDNMVGKRNAGGAAVAAEPVKKNALTACVNAVVGEIMYNALVIPIGKNPCNEFRNAATTLELFPAQNDDNANDDDDDGDLHKLCEQRFYQKLCETLLNNPASHGPVSTSRAAIAKPFCELTATTALILKSFMATFTLHKQVRNELLSEIDSLADAVVTLRCRARAVGMTFWLDLPRKPNVERKKYLGICNKKLDPTRVEALHKAAAEGHKTEYDQTRMKTKSRTTTYAFAVFPGLMGDGKVAYKEEVWCD